MASIRKGFRVHYYIKEHMDADGLSDEKLAARMDVGRTTVWKWRTQQHRLTPDKVAWIAAALDRHPSELLFPPEVPSLDALADRATPEQRAAIVADITRRLRKVG